MCSYRALCHNLRVLIMDFYGDASLYRHRRFRFLKCEFKSICLVLRGRERRLTPGLCRQYSRHLNSMRGGKSFKQTLELYYLHAQQKALLEY